MKKLGIGALVVVAALAAGLAGFVSKLGSRRATEFDVLQARLADSTKATTDAEGPLVCDAATLRSANPGKALFGVTSAAVLVRDPRGDRLLPLNVAASAVEGLRRDETPLRLAKDLLAGVPFAQWPAQLERQSIFGFGSHHTDLFVTVKPTGDALQVEVRGYVSGALLCRGSLAGPESTEPMALHDAVLTALKLEAQ